jgi:hypothetical protein
MNELSATNKLLSAATLSMGLLLLSCSGGGSTTTTTPTTPPTTGTPNAYTAVYKTLTWSNGTTVTFPTSCTMTITSTGVPSYHDPYYLGPVAMGGTQVATTPSGLKLGVVAYTPASITASTNTVNICPVKATSTTATNLGPIGYITTGEFLFNAFEATNTAALGDNVSYTFTMNGSSYTASFIDECNSHSTPANMGYTWHFHGVPTCVTTAIDGATGPSHIIGIALDGFPVYGGRDINGDIIAVSQLDACNGITSATPEFPSGAYHYVLPIGVTNSSSSMNCYTGTVSATLMARMEKLRCKMKNADGTPLKGSVMRADLTRDDATKANRMKAGM